MDTPKGYYDGAPNIPEKIKKMSIEELDDELKKYDEIRKEKEKENNK